jgi:hypothetical protein
VPPWDVVIGYAGPRHDLIGEAGRMSHAMPHMTLSCSFFGKNNTDQWR